MTGLHPAQTVWVAVLIVVGLAAGLAGITADALRRAPVDPQPARPEVAR